SGPDLEPFCLVRAPGVQLNMRRVNREPDAVFEDLWVPTKTFQTLNPHRDGVELYSVLGALEMVGLAFDGFDLLEAVCRPPAGLQTWLRASDRVTEHVLELFTKAISRSKKAAQTGERR
ncbi:MAG TPA: hypothetical protein VN903_10760, partial [Polyangia bacterium]|nr:hypothetical protein [Polyangia bacterium]